MLIFLAQNRQLHKRVNRISQSIRNVSNDYGMLINVFSSTWHIVNNDSATSRTGQLWNLQSQIWEKTIRWV